MTKPVILKNDLIYVRLEEKELYCKDSKDFYNEQTFFTKSLRWVKKLIQYAKENFNENTTFKEVGERCDKFDIRVHYYCAID